MLTVKYFILAVTLLVIASCSPSPTLSLEVYEEITTDFIEEMGQYVHENEDVEVDERIQELAEERLHTIAQRYGHSLQEYVEVAEDIGDDWDALLRRVETRANQLEMPEVQEYDIEIEQEIPADPELEELPTDEEILF